jgi:hypothetical protein
LLKYTYKLFGNKGPIRGMLTGILVQRIDLLVIKIKQWYVQT